MKVGDLIKDKRDKVGIITHDYRLHPDRPQPHVWVEWCNGASNSVHIRHLELVS